MKLLQLLAPHHPSLQGILAAAAWLQLALASLRAGSRIWFMQHHNPIGQLQGPLLTPDNDDDDVMRRWEFATAFRECLRLGLMTTAVDNNDAHHHGRRYRRHHHHQSSLLLKRIQYVARMVDSDVVSSSEDSAAAAATPPHHGSGGGGGGTSGYRLSLSPDMSMLVQKQQQPSNEQQLEEQTESSSSSSSSWRWVAWWPPRSGSSLLLAQQQQQKKHYTEAMNRRRIRSCWLLGTNKKKQESSAPRRIFNLLQGSKELWDRAASSVSVRYRNWREQLFHRADRVASSSSSSDLLDQILDTNMTLQADLDLPPSSSSSDGGGGGGTGRRRRRQSSAARVSALAPKAFSFLRRNVFDISDESYRQSLVELFPYINFQSNSKGSARVGGMFFLTQDGAYLIKTVKSDEVPTLLDVLLPKYARYVQSPQGRGSLLTRLCGMYQVELLTTTETTIGRRKKTTQQQQQVHTFLVMNSVFPPGTNIQERFDLKGSLQGRECSPEERQRKGNDAILKDLDLAREVELVKTLQQQQQQRKKGSWGYTTTAASYGLNIGARAKGRLLEQLENDVALLQDCQLIDYSLLVGVAATKREVASSSASSSFDRSHRLEQQVYLQRQLSEAKRRGDAASARRAKLLLSRLAALQALMMTAPFGWAARRVGRTARRCCLLLGVDDPYFGAGSVSNGGPWAQLRGWRHGEPATYYLGLIDFLQPYNVKKQMEYHVKKQRNSIPYYWTTSSSTESSFGVLLLNQQPLPPESSSSNFDSFSCVPPQDYADRFMEFLDRHIV